MTSISSVSDVTVMQLCVLPTRLDALESPRHSGSPRKSHKQIRPAPVLFTPICLCAFFGLFVTIKST
jgi:hypothetical protein